MAKKSKRYDIIIVPHHRSTRFAMGTGAALIRNLAAGYLAAPTAESVAEEWVEVYCEPTVASHDAFVTGAYDGEHPLYKEMVIRFGTQAVEVGYPEVGEPVAFFLEFRGALFEDVVGSFHKRVADIVYTKIDCYSKPHKRLPAHRKVPKGQEPKEKKKKSAGGGMAGTRVEEF